MSNPHLAQIHALRQNARRFWAAWQAEEARLAQLGDIDFVEQASELLHQFCPDCIVELDGIAPASGELPSLVFPPTASASIFRKCKPWQNWRKPSVTVLPRFARHRVAAMRLILVLK